MKRDKRREKDSLVLAPMAQEREKRKAKRERRPMVAVSDGELRSLNQLIDRRKGRPNGLYLIEGDCICLIG